MPMTGLAIGAGAGLLKSELIDIPAQQRALALQAAIARYSPWTHMQAHPEAVSQPNPFSSALQFGAAGAMMGAGKNRADLDEAMANRLNTGGSLGGWGGGYGRDIMNNGLYDKSATDYFGLDPNSPWAGPNNVTPLNSNYSYSFK